MITSIRRTLNPAWYHGKKFRPPFFEGWYFKLVNADETHKLAVIPGVFKASDPADSHAFVQVLDGVQRTSQYATYDMAEFRARENAFKVFVGQNHFELTHLKLDLDQRDFSLQGEMSLAALKPWPVTLLSPGVMGWYAWIPMMECFHGVLSMDHALDGSLTLNGQSIDFTGGRGYLEKDWGRAFPKGYIWFQSNHFDLTGASLSASIAIIPWIRKPFPGFIVGFLCDGKLYRFATYTGARIEALSIDDDQVHWVVKKRSLMLEMRAKRSEGGILQAPTLQGMDRRIVESMNSTVYVRLSERRGKIDHTIFEGTGRNCGLEAAGEVDRLVAMER